MHNTTKQNRTKWFFAWLGICLLAACVRPHPDLSDWTCEQAQDCGTAYDFACLEGRCRALCEQNDDCDPDRGEHCDGKYCVSDSLECKGTEQRACYNGPPESKDKGECKAGNQTCLKGKWGPCKDEITPHFEYCDKKDNNCDGKVDEVCFTNKTFKDRDHPAFEPVFSADGRHMPSLSYDSWLKYRRVSDGEYDWYYQFALAGGIATTKTPIETPGGKQQVVGASELYKNANNKIHLRVRFYEQHDSQTNHTHNLELGEAQSPGALFIAPDSSFLLTLDPKQQELLRVSPIGGKTASVTPSILRLRLEHKEKETKTCTPLRLALDDKDVAITCPGFQVTASSEEPEQRQIPLPDALKSNALLDSIFLVSLGSNKMTVGSAPSVCKTPVDVAFGRLEKTRYLLVTCFGALTSKGDYEKPGLAIYNLSTNKTRYLELPAPKGNLARPVGVRIAPDGIVVLSIQEFQASSPYELRQGRLSSHHLAELVEGKWTPIESLPTAHPPAFITQSPDGKAVLVVSPHDSQSDFILLTRP